MLPTLGIPPDNLRRPQLTLSHIPSIAASWRSALRLFRATSASLVSRSVTESGGLVWSTPKTWERRSVPFPAALADELAALMVGKGRDELVFTDLRGGCCVTRIGGRGCSSQP
jgi:hypothetical protein